jgi:hypothetical protein
MKRISAILILIISINTAGFSQEVLTKEDCIKNEAAPKVYIPGYKDCIIGGSKNISFRINPEILKNGFELMQTDSSFKIISFFLTFDFGEDIIEMPSTGNKILPRNYSIVSLSKIEEATLITIDNIRVTRGNSNYKLPSLVLYCVKE